MGTELFEISNVEWRYQESRVESQILQDILNKI